MNVFKIPEANMEKLQKALARVEKKCNKYNVPFTYRVVGEEFCKVFRDPVNLLDPEIIRLVLVEVDGSVHHNGWNFVATLDHEYSRNIIRSFNGFQVPEYLYTADCQCEHCNIRRARKHTFILQNEETGELKQIGSTCVKEFTGGMDAEAVAAFAEVYQKADSFVTYEPGSTPYIRYYRTSKILRMAAQFIAAFGYIPTSEPDSTKDNVITAYNLLQKMESCVSEYQYAEDVLLQLKYASNILSDEDADAYVEEVIQWAVASEDTSEYIQNIKSLLQEEYIRPRDIGYAVSSISSYKKWCYREKQQADKRTQYQKDMEVSQYVGEENQKLEVSIVSFELVYSGDSMYGGYYVYRFKDAEGNIFTWGTSKSLDGSKLDQIKKVRGTVKKHEIYRDVKQTVLTRCKVEF